MYEIRKGDTGRVFSVQVLGADGLPVSLVGVTSVAFVMTHKVDGRVITGVATIVDAALGKLSYTFALGQTDKVGVYLVKFVATFSGGKVETYPTCGGVELEVCPA